MELLRRNWPSSMPTAHRAAYPGGVCWLRMEQPAGIAAQVAALAGPGGLDLPGAAALDFAGPGGRRAGGLGGARRRAC